MVELILSGAVVAAAVLSWVLAWRRRRHRFSLLLALAALAAFTWAVSVLGPATRGAAAGGVAPLAALILVVMVVLMAIMARAAGGRPRLADLEASQYRAIVEQAPLGIALIGRDNRIRTANPALSRLLGHPAAELVGRDYREFTHPDDAELDGELQLALGDGVTTNVSIEKRCLLPSGEPRWVRFIAHVGRESSGSPQYGVAIVEDVGERRELQDSLSRERALVRSVIDTAPDFIYVKDLEGRFLVSNRAHAEELCGALPGDVVGKSCADYFPAETAARYGRQDRRVIDTGEESLNQEEAVVDRNGESRICLVSKAPLRDAQRRIIGVVSVGRDITERRNAQRALIENRSRLNLINDLASRMAAGTPFGEMLRFAAERIESNLQGARAIYGVVEENGEFRTVSASGSQPESTPTRQKRRPSISAEMLGKIEAGEIVMVADVELSSLAETIRTTLADESARAYLAVPVGGGENETQLLAATAAEPRQWSLQDINTLTDTAEFLMLARESDRVRRERELAVGELRRFRESLDSSDVGIVLVDFETGRLIDANQTACKWLEKPRGELIRKNARRVIATSLIEGEESWRKHIEEMTRRGQSTTRVRLTMVSPLGRRRSLEASLSLHMTMGRRVLTAVARDVSRALELESQLMQAQKMEAVGRLAGGVAHDFNNQLTAILGYSELLNDELADQPHLAEQCEEIRKAAERAARLTGQLLAFSRQRMVQPQALDLNHLVRDMETMLRRLIGEHIVLESRTAAEPAWILSDPGLTEQVILNLVINARDAMHEGGRVVLATGRRTIKGPEVDSHSQAPPGKYWALSIEDVGQGISEENLTRVFEPFFTTKSDGVGLGLAIVYGAVKQLSGGIAVDSHVGRGTRFTVLIPATEAPADAGRRAPRVKVPFTRREILLLVEDDDSVRSIAGATLRGAGYNVIEARDGAEALDVLDRQSDFIDLVLSDIVMPTLGGIELSRRMARRGLSISVLLMTGYSEERVADGAVLPKPFTPAQLLAAVREILDRGVRA